MAQTTVYRRLGLGLNASRVPLVLRWDGGSRKRKNQKKKKLPGLETRQTCLEPLPVCGGEVSGGGHS